MVKIGSRPAPFDGGLARQWRDGRLRLRIGATPRGEATNENVEDRRKDQAEKCHTEHSGENGGAE
jgi:hypothetical protein